MKDLEKAAAKLRSSNLESKAAKLKWSASAELEQIKREAMDIIDSMDLSSADTTGTVSANADKSTIDQRKQGVPNKPYQSSIDKFESPSSENRDFFSSFHNSTANGYESRPPIDQDLDFQQIKIPLKALRESGHITPGVKTNRLTEEYRRIKRPLIHNLNRTDLPNNRNLVMVTSAMAGEGKTFTSINLAMSLAQEKGRQVIFIDADIFKGSAGLKFGASKEVPGLIDVLSGTVTDLREVIQQTNVSNLWFISAGHADSHANELLASDRMERCVQEITNLFEECIVVFDCPPVLLTNEANVLLYHAGQIVFVVAERISSQRHVNSALKQIDDSKYVGIVLNKSRNRRAEYSYGYS